MDEDAWWPVIVRNREALAQHVASYGASAERLYAKARIRGVEHLVAVFDAHRELERERASDFAEFTGDAPIMPVIDAETRMLRAWWRAEGLPTTRDWR